MPVQVWAQQGVEGGLHAEQLTPLATAWPSTLTLIVGAPRPFAVRTPACIETSDTDVGTPDTLPLTESARVSVHVHDPASGLEHEQPSAR